MQKLQRRSKASKPDRLLRQHPPEKQERQHRLVKQLRPEKLEQQERHRPANLNPLEQLEKIVRDRDRRSTSKAKSKEKTEA